MGLASHTGEHDDGHFGILKGSQHVVRIHGGRGFTQMLIGGFGRLIRPVRVQQGLIHRESPLA